MFRKRSSLRSGKLAKKRRRALYLKTGVTVVAIALVIAGSAYGLSRPEVTIQDIHIEGNAALSAADIEAVVANELAGHYLFLFPKKSVLLYPHNSVVASVRNVFKRVNSISVSRNGFQAIDITISEREPYATWCEGEAAYQTSPPIEDEIASSTDTDIVGEETVPHEPVLQDAVCYFLDEGGYIFTKAPRFSGDVYFRYYGPITATEPIGSQYLDENVFRQLVFFLDSVQKLDITAVALRADEKDYELWLGSGAVIRFGQDQELSDVLNNLESVLASDVFKEKDLGQLEYIDLRFGNKVFYRFLNQ